MTLPQYTPRGEARAVSQGTAPAELHGRAHKPAQRQAFAITAPRVSPENYSMLLTSFCFFFLQNAAPHPTAGLCHHCLVADHASRGLRMMCMAALLKSRWKNMLTFPL